jgi:manganese-dependent inorganic pyrophosphatase
MADRMARIAKVSLEELGRDIFSASLEGKDARDLLFADYKEFHIAGHDFAIGQVTCVDSPGMLERKDSFLEEMAKIRADRRFSMVLLMLTDVLLEGTQLLFLGDEEVISQAFGVIPKDNMVFLPRVMSRKKQVVPSLSALWG